MRCVVNVRWLNTLIIGVLVLVGFSGWCLRAWGWWRLCRCACIASSRLRPLSLPVSGSVRAGGFRGVSARGCCVLWLVFRAVPCFAPMVRFPLRTAGAAFLGVSRGFASRAVRCSARCCRLGSPALALLGAVGLGAIGSVLMPFSNRQVKFLFFRPSWRAPDARFLSFFPGSPPNSCPRGSKNARFFRFFSEKSCFFAKKMCFLCFFT